MISYLKGKVIVLKNSQIILVVNDIGYRVAIKNSNNLNVDSEAELFIHEHIREDADDFYGFSTFEELELFEKLITVSGVGPKAGMAIMSTGSTEEIKGAIQSGNLAFFKSVSGIGAKVAVKIILELKSKISSVTNQDIVSGFDESSEVVDALVSLGYKKQELGKILAKMPSDMTNVEEKIRWVLKNLS